MQRPGSPPLAPSVALSAPPIDHARAEENRDIANRPFDNVSLITSHIHLS